MKHKEANFISAVLYLHRKDKNIAFFLEMLYRILNAKFRDYEIICVDDDAEEYVLEQIRDFKKNRNVTISIIDMGFRQGVEAGMNAGVDLSIGDYVFEFDSSYVDYDEGLIIEAYEKCMQGYDIVSVRLPRSGWRMSSKMFYRLYNRYSDTDYELATERFCIISRRAVNRVSAYSKIIPYRKAVYAVSGLKLSSVEYTPVQKSTQGNHFEDAGRINLATDAIVLFTDIAYRVSLLFSIIMAAVMFGFGIYTIIAYFVSDKIVVGWSPLMGLISLGFLSLFLLMTFMFKYLEVIVRLIFKKQKYTVRSVQKIG